MKKLYSKSSRKGLPGGPNEIFQKVKGIIISERGQWDFPGMNTLVPTQNGRITMRGVPYPVLGQDETGYTQMMYPEQEYQFPGKNVLELPMAQKGLQNKKLQPWEYLDKEGDLHTNIDKLPFDPRGREKYAEELNWMHNWISNRRPQMQSAIQSYYDRKDEKYPVDAFFREYVTAPLFGEPYAYDLTPEWNVTNEQLGRTILHNSLSNLKELKFKDSSKINPKSYVPSAWGSYTPDGHYIYFAGENPSEETKIHEIGHGTKLGSQKLFHSLIKDIIKNDQIYKTKYDKYFHSPEEIYSRIWELRKGLGLKPSDKIDKKILKEKLQKINSDDSLDIFKRLKPDTVIKLLNELVYNEPASELPMAQRGGVHSKFQSGGEKDEETIEEPKPFELPKGKGYFFSETGETNLPKRLEEIEKRKLTRNDFQTEEDYVNFLTSNKSKFKDFSCRESGCAEFANNRSGELVGLGGADYATWIKGGKYEIGAGGHAWQTYGNLLSLGGKSIFNNYKKQGDIFQAKPGDIVGLKGGWSVYDRSNRYDISGENAPRAGVDNSHQGVVEYVDSKGNVYVRHNVGGKTRVRKIVPTENGYKLNTGNWNVVTIARPNFERYKYADIKYRDELNQHYVEPYISDYNPDKAVVFKNDVVLEANPRRYRTDWGNFMIGEQDQKIDWLTGQSNLEPFPVTEKSGNEDMQKFVDSLNDNKKALMDYYRLSDDEFNTIAQIAIATAGAESNFGTSSKLALKTAVPDIARGLKIIRDQEYYPRDEMSVGIGQVKPYSLDETFKQIFGVHRRNLKKPEKNALAVFSHLVDDTRKAKRWAERNKDLPEEVRTNYPFLGAAVYVNPWTVATGNLTYDESWQNNLTKPYEAIGLDNQRLRTIWDYLKDIEILDTSKLYRGQPLEEIKITPQEKYGGSLPKAQKLGEVNNVVYDSPEYRRAYAEGKLVSRLNSDPEDFVRAGTLPAYNFDALQETGRDIKEVYPNFNSLTEEEKRYFRDTSPIGRSIRRKATKGNKSFTDEVNDFATGMLYQVPMAALQVPQSALVEGVQALRGKDANWQSVYDPYLQRVPSDVWGFENKPGFGWEDVGNFAMDMSLDPTNLVAAGFLKSPIKTAVRTTLDPTGLFELTGRGFNQGKKFLVRNTPRQLPGSPNAVSGVDDVNRSKREFWNTGEEITNNNQLNPQRPISERFTEVYDENLLREDVLNRVSDTPDLSSLNYPNLGTRQLIDKISQYRQAKEAKEAVKKLVNKSGLTKEQAIAKASSKDKDVIAKMTDNEFKNTALRPSGEVVTYYQGSLMPQLTGKNNIRALTSQKYVDIFNSKIDLLNEIIAKNNRTGVQYRVKHLTPNGRLVFETPKQKVSRNLTETQKKNLELFERDPEDFAVKKLGLKQTEDGKWVFKKEGDTVFDTKEDALNFLNKEIDRNFRDEVIEGTSEWVVRIKPGEWRGDVEDIINEEYFKSIPGLEMTDTRPGPFSDFVRREGSGAYKSINEYLKQLGLGRVKPGFNSQSKYARGAWENFINSDRAVGFLGSPTTIYGAMKQRGGAYNMQRALELGYTPDETGHWPSVDSTNGMWLKSKQHPTAWMEYMQGYALNPENNRRFDVVPNVEGYFGDNQLQYVDKKQTDVSLQTDPILDFVNKQRSRKFSKSKK